ncbi:MAG: peptidoglycan editing factor PgeF [Bacteroidetes bacterium]|nr:peptidoglycan editing factor PgeF [Bacteroidota bacterium]
MWLHAPNISATHGFSTRSGGVSPAPFDSMNLAGHDDDPNNIEKNRALALAAININPSQIANLKQIHGCDVVKAKPGTFSGDALVSNEKGIALAVAAADCYPLLFHDEKNHVIGAAHAGWRGTLARIAEKTILQMVALGAEAKYIHMAIGPGISQQNFEVGEEVIQLFRDAKFPEKCFDGRHLDLIQVNKTVAIQSHLLPQNIWTMNRCTYEKDFFSYRRDNGKTGRMWGVISL